MERGGDWRLGEFHIPPANLCGLSALGQDLGVDLCPRDLTPQEQPLARGTGSQGGLLAWVGGGGRLPSPQSAGRSDTPTPQGLCRLGVTRLRLSLQIPAAWDGFEKLQK